VHHRCAQRFPRRRPPDLKGSAWLRTSAPPAAGRGSLHVGSLTFWDGRQPIIGSIGADRPPAPAATAAATAEQPQQQHHQQQEKQDDDHDHVVFLPQRPSGGRCHDRRYPGARGSPPAGRAPGAGDLPVIPPFARRSLVALVDRVEAEPEHGPDDGGQRGEQRSGYRTITTCSIESGERCSPASWSDERPRSNLGRPQVPTNTVAAGTTRQDPAARTHVTIISLHPEDVASGGTDTRSPVEGSATGAVRASRGAPLPVGAGGPARWAVPGAAEGCCAR
jgi:hypothetical protein